MHNPERLQKAEGRQYERKKVALPNLLPVSVGDQFDYMVAGDGHHRQCNRRSFGHLFGIIKCQSESGSSPVTPRR